jgi:hypothetical protein
VLGVTVLAEFGSKWAGDDAYRCSKLFQPMESWTVSQCADVHNLEVMQTIPEVLVAGGVSIHHFQLMTAAAKILLHHFPSLFFPEETACPQESSPPE